MDNGKLLGSGKMFFDGYPKIFSGYELDRANKDEVRNKVVGFARKGSNKFNLQKYDIIDLDDRDRPTVINYDFEVSDYFQVVDNEVYLNLNLTKDRRNKLLSLTRTAPYEREYKHLGSEVIEFKVPDNYTVEYLPKDASWKSDSFSFSVTYTNVPGKIIYKRQVRLDDFLVEPNQFKDWNDANKAAAEADKETIILKKK
jgi:hypothetical protein